MEEPKLRGYFTVWVIILGLIWIWAAYPEKETTVENKHLETYTTIPIIETTTIPIVTEPPTTVPVTEEPVVETEAPLTKTTKSSKRTEEVAISENPDMSNMPAGCIRKYESGGTTDEGGNYQDSGGGAYQIIHSTWDGYGGYANAEDAPNSVQDAKAAELWAQNGQGHWAAQKGRCF